MPSPVLAFPCGSKSMTRTRFFAAASAVARLIAVVVLPTPPFWLASATMFGARAAGRRAVSASVSLKMVQSQDGGRRVGSAGQEVGCHIPRASREGQFALGAAPFEKQRDCVRLQHRGGEIEQPVE